MHYPDCFNMINLITVIFILQLGKLAFKNILRNQIYEDIHKRRIALGFNEYNVENTFDFTKKISTPVTSTPNKNQDFGTHQTSGFIIKKDNLCYFAIPPTSAAVDPKPSKIDSPLQARQCQVPSFLIKKDNLYFHAIPPLHQAANWSLKPDLVPSSLRKVENKIPVSTVSSASEQNLPVVSNIHSSNNLSLGKKLKFQQKEARKFYSNKKRHLCRPFETQKFNSCDTMRDIQKKVLKSHNTKHFKESPLESIITSDKKFNHNHHKSNHTKGDNICPSGKSSLVYSPLYSLKLRPEVKNNSFKNSYTLRNAIDPKNCKNDSLSNTTVQQNCIDSTSTSIKEMENTAQKAYLSSLNKKVVNSLKDHSNGNEQYNKEKSSSSVTKSKSSSTMEQKVKPVKKISLSQYKKRIVENTNQNVPEKSKILKQEKDESRESSVQTQIENTGSDLSSSQNLNSTMREKNSHHSSINMSKVGEGKGVKTFAKESDIIKPVKSENKNINEETKSLRSGKSLFYGEKGKHSVAKKVKHKPAEDPVILTLSSDEEDENGDNAAATDNSISSSNSSSNSKFNNKNYDEELFSMSTEEDFVALKCKSVLIGSYRVVPKARLKITRGCFTMVVPPVPKDIEPVKLIMNHVGIVQVAVNFEDEYPVFFLYIKPSMGTYIVNLLKMSSERGPYIDPRSKDERKIRITIFTEKIKPEFILSIKDFWTNLSSSSKSSSLAPVLVEISSEEATDIIEKIIPPIEEKISKNDQESKKLFMYPLPPQTGGITITTSDYSCLEEELFLNDVIIDFYLKYLMLDEDVIKNDLGKKFRKETHVFSTFFYKRLTSKPKNQEARLEEATMTAAQRRHRRVQSWTKNVDIFSKCFVLVPINEHSHWFLAVICFPGLDGPKQVNLDSESFSWSEILASSGKPAPKLRKMRFETPLMRDSDWSDRDEAEGDDDEHFHEGGGEEFSTPKKISNITKESSSPKSNNQETIIRPCILVFDSLPGCSPSRIVATLRDYLSVEYEAKKNKKKVFDKESMKAACPKVPKQDNFSDCGLYTLQYAESFFQCPLKDFSLPVGSLQYWFKDEIIKCKRQVIANLIKTLTMQFNPNQEIQLPKLYFATPKNLKKQKEKHEKSSQVAKFETEKLSKVRKNGIKRKESEFSHDKNRTLSLFDDFVRYPNQCSLRSAVKKKEVDEGISHEAKKLKLESNGENSIEDSNFQSIFSPIDTSDDNDSGHHSDIDNSKDSLNKAFSEEEPSSMDIGFNSENTFHKLKNTLESNDLSSKSELVTKNNLESNDLFSETEITSQNNSLSLVPNEIKRYGKSYERVKKLSLASRKVTPNNVCSELACVKNINDR